MKRRKRKKVRIYFLHEDQKYPVLVGELVVGRRRNWFESVKFWPEKEVIKIEATQVFAGVKKGHELASLRVIISKDQKTLCEQVICDIEMPPEKETLLAQICLYTQTLKDDFNWKSQLNDLCQNFPCFLPPLLPGQLLA